MRGHNLRNFCRDVLGHLRDLLVVKVSGDPKLLDSSSVQATTLQQQAALFSESDLVRFFHSLAETESSLKDAANPRYQVEVGLVKLMEMRRLATLGDLVERIGELEDALRRGKPPAERKTPQSAPDGGSGKPAARSATSGGSSRSAAASGYGSAHSSERIIERSGDGSSETTAASGSTPNEASVVSSNEASGSLLDQIKAALEKKKRRLLIAALDGACRAELEGEEFLIEFAPEARHYRDTLAKTDAAKALREACAEVCGREIGIRFAIKASGPENNEPVSAEEEERRAKQRARQAVAQNPTVQQVLRAFGGEIVDVKMQ